jgi:type II secretory pathway pseudopilin PulG
MIVVAIIGILTTIAIPAFATYSANAKTQEARLNLDSIGKGALAFYSQEHPYNHGTMVHTHEYPTTNNTSDTAKKNAKGDSSVQPIGGMPYQSYNPGSGGGDSKKWNDGNSQRGVKHNPEDFEWSFSHYPWLDLNFRITSPFYYSYNYNSSVNGKDTYFGATASACLLRFCVQSGKVKDAKGKEIPSDCDSGFVIAGGPHGTVTAVLDNSDFTIEQYCGRADLGHIKNGLKKKGIDLYKY